MNKNELIEKLEKAETMDEAKAIKEQLDKLAEHEALAAEKAAVLDSLKAKEPVVSKHENEPKTLGEFAVKNLDMSAMREGRAKSAGTEFSFKAATDPHTSVPVTVVDQNVVDTVANRELRIRDLFGSESISGTSLQYFVMGTTEGAPAATAEGAQKPQFHIPTTPKTVTLKKIAGWYYETDELIDDNAFLKTSIDNRGLFELRQAIETDLMTTLQGTNGIQSVTYTGALNADKLFEAIMAVKNATNYDADTIVINPVDYQTLRLAKDSNLQYYGGGYFFAPYGNGAAAQQPGIWGLTTIVTTAVAAGTVLVGAFRAGASVITKAGEGVRVEVVTGDHDDRTNNRVTVVVEERLALAVRVPAAFAKVSQ